MASRPRESEPELPGLPTGCEPSDFRVETGRSQRGTFVRVVHIPTGKSACVDPIGSRAPNDVACALLHVLDA